MTLDIGDDRTDQWVTDVADVETRSEEKGIDASQVIVDAPDLGK